jgi:hypothetical protein
MPVVRGPAASDSADADAGLRRPGPHLGHGSGDILAIKVVRRGTGESVPRHRQRVSNVTGIDRHPTVTRT